MCCWEFITCETCRRLVDVVDEPCKLMKLVFNCENGQAFRNPSIRKVVCFACIKVKMSTIQHAISSPRDEKVTVEMVNVWLEDVASPAASTDSGTDKSVAMSPG